MPDVIQSDSYVVDDDLKIFKIITGTPKHTFDTFWSSKMFRITIKLVCNIY